MHGPKIYQGDTPQQLQRKIAVVGTGIAGMSAAWLLAQRHSVTIFERDYRIGGHCNTIEVPNPSGPIAVDTGFIVYNEPSYPNFTALLEHLGVPSHLSNMSFSASLEGGSFEYAGSNLYGLFAQKRSLFRPRMWAMVKALLKFYKQAPTDINALDPQITLGEYLEHNGYSAAFVNDHLLPMAAAIWSSPLTDMRKTSALAFLRFFESHGLLRLRNRIPWRTVTGGCRSYVEKLTKGFAGRVRLDTGVKSVTRRVDGAWIEDTSGLHHRFDEIVIAAHADQALSMLSDPNSSETTLLEKFRYQRNEAVLHQDSTFMPRNKRAWASWNYSSLGSVDPQTPSITYWMNRLQGIDPNVPLFVTLNPPRKPLGQILGQFTYVHPVLDTYAQEAQTSLWSLQGTNRTWFCGSYFGSGFHEDALQSALSVAEQLGGVRRPWIVSGESSRIFLQAHETAATR